MKKLHLWVTLLILLGFGNPFYAVSQEDPDPSAREGPVLGTPGSREELEAWREISEADDIETKGERARLYLEKFPNGGYAPYVREILAFYYQQRNDPDNFFKYAEQALEELPGEAALLVALSVEYAERQKPDPAIEHGEHALEVLSSESPAQPPDQDAGLGQERRTTLSANAHYGVGTAYLLKAFNSRGNTALMDRATDHLEKAVRLSPLEERSHFRLGFAYQLQNDLEKAVTSYAKALALEGPNAAMARSYLEKAYTALHGSARGMDKLVSEQKEYLKEQ